MTLLISLVFVEACKVESTSRWPRLSVKLIVFYEVQPTFPSQPLRSESQNLDFKRQSSPPACSPTDRAEYVRFTCGKPPYPCRHLNLLSPLPFALRSEPEMRDYVAGKGFVRLPFETESARHKAAESFGVQALPTLIIVNGDTGNIVTAWGRSAITKNPQGCLEEWKAGRHGVTWLQLLKPW